MADGCLGPDPETLMSDADQVPTEFIKKSRGNSDLRQRDVFQMRDVEGGGSVSKA
jgi:hypothetical protein